MATLTKKDIEEGEKLLKVIYSLDSTKRLMVSTYINALGDQQRAQEITKSQDINKKEGDKE